MIPVKSLSLGCLALVISSSTLLSQTSRKIAFRTLCLERVNDIGTVVIPGNNPDDSLKIELFTDVSPVTEGIFKSEEAAFYIEKGKGPDGKPIRVLVGKTLLGKSERQLFLFAPGETGEGKLPYIVKSFDDDTKVFPMGNIRAINLSPVPVRFNLSGQVTPQIPPTKFAQFPHSAKVNDYNMYPVVVEFLSGNGEWIKGQSVSWKATDRRREIVVTTVDTKFKQPTVQIFVDFPPWMEAPPAAPAPR
jgi:hypothetical protein